MVLRLRQHNTGYTADGIYMSDDPTKNHMKLPSKNPKKSRHHQYRKVSNFRSSQQIIIRKNNIHSVHCHEGSHSITTLNNNKEMKEIISR